LKIGVFDIEIMMQVMPGYRGVDSLVQSFERDSLAAEYQFYQSEYQRLDSTYKLDSAANKAKTILDMEKQQRQQVAMNLVYWQQIAQNKSDQKRAVLAQPLYEKVVTAYKKVLDVKKYTLILKPNTFEAGTQVENIFELVAKELKIPLPRELGGMGNSAGGDDEERAQPKPAQGAKPATRPAGRN
jgi:Skp family chaperone for outer membrane proteins